MLKSRQIAMEIETAEAVDSLRSDIQEVDRSVTRINTALTAEIARVETSLTAKIQDVEASVTSKIEHVEMSLSAKMDEQKRHADVHFESVHGDIRMLAEHLVSLTVKIDSVLR